MADVDGRHPKKRVSLNHTIASSITVMPRPAFNAANILEIDPSREGTCSGKAITQGGIRCGNLISRDNRMEAMRCLDRISNELYDGRPVDYLLARLAKRLLCRRWHGKGDHRDQTAELVEKWSTLIDDFVQQHPLPGQSTLVASPEGDESHISLSEGRSLFNSVSVAARPVLQSAGTEVNHDPGTPSTDLNVVASSNQNPEPPISAQDSEEIAPRRPRIVLSASRTPVTRRPVEGDCGICMERLRLGHDHDEGLGEEGDEHATGDAETDRAEDLASEEHTSEVDEGYESDVATTVATEPQDALRDDHAEVDSQNQSLIWCQRQCGQNFHRSCATEWILTRLDHYQAPTCPTWSVQILSVSFCIPWISLFLLTLAVFWQLTFISCTVARFGMFTTNMTLTTTTTMIIMKTSDNMDSGCEIVCQAEMDSPCVTRVQALRLDVLPSLSLPSSMSLGNGATDQMNIDVYEPQLWSS